MTKTQAAISRATSAAGSSAELAKLLHVHHTLVHQWRKGLRPVAARHCPGIEAATGVRCEELRPDLHWLRDASGAATGHLVPTRAA